MSTQLHPRTPALRLLSVAACAVALVSASAAAGGKKVIGKLGQALRDVGIHSRMSSGSHVYYHTKQFEYLVVNQTRSSQWTSVVLQGGYKGYIPTDAVALLPYNILSPTRPRNLRPPAQISSSRGGGDMLPPSDTGGVANYALSFIGTPYKWGGTNLASGIDCSGFVQKMFGTIGVSLPRTAAEQVNYGQAVTRLEYLEKGDRLYFWDAKRGKIGHTGIYLGLVQGKPYFVHSSHGKGGVATSMLTSSWIKTLIAARRS